LFPSEVLGFPLSVDLLEGLVRSPVDPAWAGGIVLGSVIRSSSLGGEDKNRQ
jgi:hypothetical protein